MIRVLGLDPAFRNVGMALVDVDLHTKELHPVDLRLIVTEKDSSKQVRVSSDKLRRASEIAHALRQWQTRASIVAAEIPTGGQDANSAASFGISIGLLGSLTLPLIEVSPAEAKLAATGKKTATKPQMIEWATTTWPDLNWLRLRDKPTGRLLDANEHLADAIAIVKAATLTKQFDQAVAMYRVMVAE